MILFIVMILQLHALVISKEEGKTTTCSFLKLLSLNLILIYLKFEILIE